MPKDDLRHPEMLNRAILVIRPKNTKKIPTYYSKLSSFQFPLSELNYTKPIVTINSTWVNVALKSFYVMVLVP